MKTKTLKDFYKKYRDREDNKNPLDPYDVKGKKIYPCLRTFCYKIIMESGAGATPHEISDILKAKLEDVTKHIEYLAQNKHVFWHKKIRNFNGKHGKVFHLQPHKK